MRPVQGSRRLAPDRSLTEIVVLVIEIFECMSWSAICRVDSPARSISVAGLAEDVARDHAKSSEPREMRRSPNRDFPQPQLTDAGQDMPVQCQPINRAVFGERTPRATSCSTDSIHYARGHRNRESP